MAFNNNYALNMQKTLFKSFESQVKSFVLKYDEDVICSYNFIHCHTQVMKTE